MKYIKATSHFFIFFLSLKGGLLKKAYEQNSNRVPTIPGALMGNVVGPALWMQTGRYCTSGICNPHCWEYLLGNWGKEVGKNTCTLPDKGDSR